MYDGELQQLKDLFGTDETLVVETENSAPDLNGLYDLGVTEIEQEASKIVLRYSKRQTNSTSVISWLMSRCKLKDFVVQGTEIEEVIRRMYRNQPALDAFRTSK